MSDLDALLRAVLGRPDDDTPRLVFADALDDLGEAERAAFVRCQVELARLPKRPTGNCRCDGGGTVCGTCRDERDWDEVAEPLQRRERELLAAIGCGPGQDVEVLPGLRIPSLALAYTRGFIESLTVTGAIWVAHGDTIRLSHPVRRVVLTTVPAVVYDDPQDPVLMRFPDRTEWRSVGRFDGPQGHADRVRRLFDSEWPDIIFELPPTPVAFEVPEPPPEQTILWSIEVVRQADIGDGFVRPGRPEGRLTGVFQPPTNYFHRGQVIGPLVARSRDGGQWQITRALVRDIRHNESPNLIINTEVDAVTDGPFTRQDDPQ